MTLGLLLGKSSWFATKHICEVWRWFSGIVVVKVILILGMVQYFDYVFLFKPEDVLMNEEIPNTISGCGWTIIHKHFMHSMHHAHKCNQEDGPFLHGYLFLSNSVLCTIFLLPFAVWEESRSAILLLKSFHI